MTHSESADILSQFSFWEHLSEEEKNTMLQSLRPLSYPAGQVIYSGESDCLGALFIQTGILRSFLMSDEGKETTMYRLRDGDVCVLSAACVLSSVTFDVQVEAETDCLALLLPTPVLHRLMQKNIYVENFLHKMMTEHFSDFITAMERMFFLNLQQRIAAFLLDESAAQHSDTLTLTQEQLARAIGSAREAVSRNLKLLVKAGYVEINRGTVQIVDKKGLYEMGGF